MAGVLYPYRQVERQVATGKVLATTTVRNIVANPAVDASVFRFPPDS